MLVFLLAAPSLAAAPQLARSMYCNGQLIRTGDPVYLVARRCPQPYWVNRWIGLRIVGGTRRAPVYQSDGYEAWYLNFGPRRFMRRLVFRNGHLYRIESLGYGIAFRPGSRTCTATELANAGRTDGEIWARCGEPDHVYVVPRSAGHYSGPWPAPSHYHREIWTYDFGPYAAPRQLTFDNGKLISTRVLRR